MADLDVHEAEVILRLVDEGVDAGHFTCPDPHGTAARLTALRDGLAIQQTLFGGHHSQDEFADLLRDAIRHELGNAPPTASR
jgi:hypothetical protein